MNIEQIKLYASTSIVFLALLEVFEKVCLPKVPIGYWDIISYLGLVCPQWERKILKTTMIYPLQMQHKIFGWPRKSTNEKFQQEKTNMWVKNQQFNTIGVHRTTVRYVKLWWPLILPTSELPTGRHSWGRQFWVHQSSELPTLIMIV